MLLLVFLCIIKIQQHVLPILPDVLWNKTQIDSDFSAICPVC